MSADVVLEIIRDTFKRLLGQLANDRYNVDEVSAPASRSADATRAERIYRRGWNDGVAHAMRVIRGEHPHVSPIPRAWVEPE